MNFTAPRWMPPPHDDGDELAKQCDAFISKCETAIREIEETERIRLKMSEKPRTRTDVALSILVVCVFLFVAVCVFLLRLRGGS